MGQQYQVQYMLIKQLKGLPVGVQTCMVHARNWLEALHITKLQFGPENAYCVDVESVMSYIPHIEDVQVILYSRYRQLNAEAS